MRLKLLSAFLGILMISGLIAPLMTVNNTNGNEEIKPVETMQLSDDSNWHDDCSNITDWTYHTEWDGYTRWGTASGTLASTGASIHCPTNSGWGTGPFWFKEFSSPFSQEGFTSWDFDFQVTQPSMSYKGNLFAGLFDADKQPIFVMQFTSWNELEHELDMYCYYRFSNDTWLAYQRPSVSPNFDGVCSISYEEGVGIVAHIGASDSGILLTEAEWNLEPDRLISYIGIQWRKGAGNYLDYFINDIEITSGNAASLDSISIDSPDDIVYSAGATGNIITWTPISSIPDSFELFLNGEPVSSSSWDGSVISVNVDGLTLGIYNYSIYVNNTAGESATDWVLVTVTGTGTGTGTTGGFDYMIISISIGSIVVIVVIVGVICRNRRPGSTSVPSVGPEYQW